MEMLIPAWLTTENNPKPIRQVQKAKNPIFIYGLYDPETGELRYIGKSERPEMRYQNHLNEVSNCHRSHWIQALKRKGLKPFMEILESIDGEWPWQESERHWIARMRRLRCRLTNNTDGGDGVANLTGPGRERYLRSVRNRTLSPEARRKISEFRKTWRASEHTRAAMSRAGKGRKILWIDKIADKLRKLTDEQIQQIKSRLEAGEKNKDLAAEYGVHRTTLSKVKTGTYK
jgi:hypothetical protein